MEQFHEDMRKAVSEKAKKEKAANDPDEQYQIWEDIFFKFAREVMSRKERGHHSRLN